MNASMAGMQERYDTAFLGILQNEGQIAKFLDVVFGFLYRRTDFYLRMKQKTDKLGFPPGVASKLTAAAFKKYEEMASKNEERRQAKRREQDEKRREQEENLEKKLKEIHTEEQQKKSRDSEPMDTAMVPESVEVAAQAVGTSHPAPEPEEPTRQEKPASSEEEVAQRTSASTEPPNAVVESQSSKDIKVKSEPVAEPKEKDGHGSPKSVGNKEVDPELKKIQQRFQENPESYNGAVRDNYSWSQTISDVDVLVKVPKNTRKGGDVQVTIEKKRIKVCHRGDGGTWVTVLDGALVWEIQREQSMWSLVPGEHVHVNLEKVQERWWEAVLEDEPRISVRQIDPSRPITDLDDEAQAKIEEMMYNEHQKKIGKPQSHEQKVHDMLKQAWDADGSPFKGQAFDPSKVNITGADTGNLMAGFGQRPGGDN